MQNITEQIGQLQEKYAQVQQRIFGSIQDPETLAVMKKLMNKCNQGISEFQKADINVTQEELLKEFETIAQKYNIL